jgi:hypothetical protein
LARSLLQVALGLEMLSPLVIQTVRRIAARRDLVDAVLSRDDVAFVDARR